MFTLHAYACITFFYKYMLFMAKLHALFSFCLQCLISLWIEIYSFKIKCFVIPIFSFNA